MKTVKKTAKKTPAKKAKKPMSPLERLDNLEYILAYILKLLAGAKVEVIKKKKTPIKTAKRTKKAA